MASCFNAESIILFVDAVTASSSRSRLIACDGIRPLSFFCVLLAAVFVVVVAVVFEVKTVLNTFVAVAAAFLESIHH